MGGSLLGIANDHKIKQESEIIKSQYLGVVLSECLLVELLEEGIEPLVELVSEDVLLGLLEVLVALLLDLVHASVSELLLPCGLLLHPDAVEVRLLRSDLRLHVCVLLLVRALQQLDSLTLQLAQLRSLRAEEGGTASHNSTRRQHHHNNNNNHHNHNEEGQHGVACSGGM